MRLLVTITLPAVDADEREPEIIFGFVETWKPESVYFGADGPDRAIFLVVELDDVAQIPAMFEPLFALSTRIDFKPVLTADELLTECAGSQT